MLTKGCAALTDAELLAILIGSGNKNESAVDLAKRIMKVCHNNINELAKLSINDLRKQFKGIGEAKAVTITAALELGKDVTYKLSLTGNKLNLVAIYSCYLKLFL